MSKVKSRTVRRVVIEEDTMSDKALDFRVEEILKESETYAGISTTDFTALILISALDQGRIWLHNANEDKKRTILAAFGALEHEVNGRLDLERSRLTAFEAVKLDDYLKKAYLIG